jgi:hypothetical protein
MAYFVDMCHIFQGGNVAHTSAFRVPGIEHPVAVIHNSGWDGTATVVWEDRDGEHQARLPAGLREVSTR